MNNKQRAFVEEYLKCWNATKAALAAGYSKRTAHSIGHENLKKPEIAAEIQRRIAEKAMSADEVLARLAEQARGDIGDYMTPQGLDMKRLIADGKAHLIKKHSAGRSGTTVEFYDAQAALVHIGRYHALFTDRVLHTWRDEVLELIRNGHVTPEQVSQELGDELARELFDAAGLPRASS